MTVILYIKMVSILRYSNFPVVSKTKVFNGKVLSNVLVLEEKSILDEFTIL